MLVPIIGGGSPPSFSPSDYGTVVAWLEADRGTTIVPSVYNPDSWAVSNYGDGTVGIRAYHATSNHYLHEQVGMECSIAGTVNYNGSFPLLAQSESYFIRFAHAYIAETIPVTATLSAPRLSEWIDQGLLGNTVLQATEDNRSYLIASDMNGHPSIKNDSRTSMASAAFSGLVTPATLTIIAVFWPTNTNLGEIVGLGASTTNILQIATITNAFRFDAGGGYPTITIDNTNPVVMSVVYNGALTGANRFKVWINGSPQTMPSFAPASLGTPNTLVIGKWIGGVWYGKSKNALFLIYSDALSDANRQTVEQHYGLKYGITLA
jgi:hypothetical protein